MTIKANNNYATLGIHMHTNMCGHLSYNVCCCTFALFFYYHMQSICLHRLSFELDFVYLLGCNLCLLNSNATEAKQKCLKQLDYCFVSRPLFLSIIYSLLECDETTIRKLNRNAAESKVIIFMRE